MNKIVKRLVAVTMALFMIPGAMPSIAMAAPVTGVETDSTPQISPESGASAAITEDDAVENVENGTAQENVSDETESNTDVAAAEETPAEETPSEVTITKEATAKAISKQENIFGGESSTAFTLNANDIDVEVNTYAVNLLEAGEETEEVDTSDPVISDVEAELYDIRVLDAEGESVALTEEQIQTVLSLYQQYLQQWADNANVLGVQMPFFLQYNDKGEDGLGILGEMLVLAGYTVDDVRNGAYKYDDLVGMIQNFYYADQLGVKYYGEAIAASRNEVLAKVKDSGAATLVQKMLVINDWLAHKATFDMSYIMNMGEETPIMVAENPQKHEKYNDVYNTMYEVYEKQITQQFHDQIYDGVVAQLRQQYYEGAIKNIVMEGYKSQVRQNVIDQAVENGQTQEEAEVAADAYMAENEETIASEASAYAEKYMTDNADEISEDPDAFIKANLGGEEVAAQVSDGADNFIKDAEEKGVEVDPENAPGYKMTVEDLTQQTMKEEKIVDLDGDGTNDTTANDAIPIYAEQAAKGLTEGILGAWEGNHIGILSGYNTGVCCGYAKAFAYLMQYMMPEIYGINGAGTDMSVSSNWKTAENLYYDEEGKLDISKNYAVDLVRVTFQTDVTMYGEVNEGFNSDHFWNAVQVDGKWYYIDPCYIDVYTEVMSRDRVEMDGNLNHMYFMFSHSTAAEMYDGYMGGDGIKSLYADVATDKSYEDSWYARVTSNAYSDGSYFYYLYDSSDMFGLMREMNSSSDADYEKFLEMTNSEYKLVRHKISDNDIAEGGADSDYDTLIEFNHKVNEDDDDDTTVARVNVNGEMVENELLTKLFAQFKEESEIYPSIAISTALYNGKLYFNLSNCILSYDLSSGEVVKVKEYNTVYGARDNKNAFGGMAFSVVDSASEATHTVENHPIASMTIKDDGKMYVSIATNFAYISGKDPHDCADSEENGYGYEFEESNYNPDYSTYFDMDEISAEFGEIDSDSQDNDNDEFMWSAVFVDTLDMIHLASGSHSYSAVTVEPFCGRDGFTENRCTECGAIKADSRVLDEGSACDHHYIHFNETYYTKDDTDNWNTGECYVCTICGSAVSEPVEPEKNSQESDEDFAERQKQYEEDKAEYEAIVKSAGHVYATSADSVTWNTDEESGDIVSATVAANTYMVCEPCEGKELDVLHDQDEATSIDLSEEVTLDDIDIKAIGKCEDGLTVTYTATGTTETGVKLSASKTEKTEAGVHAYKAEFTWTPESKTDGSIPYNVTAVFKCKACEKTIKDGIEVEVVVDEDNSVAANCTEPGKTVYLATATAKDAEGNVIASGKNRKTDEIPARGHDYDAEFTWDNDSEASSGYKVTAVLTCKKGDDTQTLTCKDENITKETIEEATPFSEGTIRYTAVVEYKGEKYSGTKDETVPVKILETPTVSDPTNVAGGVKVAWNAVDGATSYKVYRKDSEESDWGDSIAEVTTTSYTDTSVESGETYAYSVQAIATEGDKHVETEYDQEGKSIQYIAVPTLTKVYNGNGKMTVSWDAVKGAQKYRLFVKSGSVGWTKVADTDGTSAVFTGNSKLKLTSGTSYCFTVRCINEDSTVYTSYYDTKGKTLTYISQPEMTQISNTTDGIKVTWKKVGGAKTYRLWVKSGNVGWKKVADTTGTSAVFKGVSDIKMANGTKYTFTVSCIDENTKKNVSSYNSGKTLLRLSNPSVTVSNASSGITVKWGKITGAKGYYVYRKTGDGSWKKIATIKSGSTVSYSDTAVKSKNNTEYSYTVRAYNGSTMSYYTGKKTIRLTTPTISSATNNKSKLITVKWNKNNSVTGYKVSYKTGSTEKTVTIKGKTNVSTTIKKLTKNKTYTVKVRSYKTVNGVNYYSGWSSSKKVKIKK